MSPSNDSRRLEKKVPRNVSQATIHHFNAQPWLQETLHDPAFCIVPLSRETTHNDQGHTLMGKTLNTDSTIVHALSLLRPSRGSEKLTFPQPEHERAEIRRFYTFGNDLTSHPNLLHGGVVACILDSSLGRAAGFILEPHSGDTSIFTVQLNITYRKPVRTPGTIATKAWVTSVEDGGRKIWARGVMEGDGGVLHAIAEGMWLRSPAPKEKL